MTLSVFLDANVLVPIAMTDVLLSLGSVGSAGDGTGIMQWGGAGTTWIAVLRPLAGLFLPIAELLF